MQILAKLFTYEELKKPLKAVKKTVKTAMKKKKPVVDNNLGKPYDNVINNYKKKQNAEIDTARMKVGKATAGIIGTATAIKYGFRKSKSNKKRG